MNAVLNWGHWIVHCANPACAGASMLGPGQTTVICECHDQYVCEHGPVCAAIYKVDWPADVEGIEAAMVGRTRDHRHWYPPETVAALLAENEMHGVT